MLKLQMVSGAVFVITSVLSLFGVFLTLAFLVFNMKYRKMRLVRMSSPNLNVLIALGGLLSYCCCLMFGTEAVMGADMTSLTLTCQARTWLLTFSITLVFGTMTAKSWRVFRIFRGAGARRVIIKDWKLVTVIAALLCIDTIILGFWHGMDPLTTQRVIIPTWVFSFPEVTNTTPIVVTSCSSGSIQIWLCILFLYKTALLISGLYLAWATRNVVLPAINESKFTILGTFATTVVCSVGAALSVVLRSSPDVSCICLAIAVWISATTCLLLVFVPKIRLISCVKNTTLARQAMKFTPSAEFLPTDSVAGEEMCYLVSENRYLKKSLTDKDLVIQSLQEHLDSATATLQQLSEEAEVKNDSGLDVDLSSSTSVSTQDDEEDRAQYNVALHVPDENSGVSVESDRTDIEVSLTKTEISESNDSFITPADHVSSSNASSVVTLRVKRQRISKRKRLAALRDSIAEDLQQAHGFMTSLQESISKDLDQLPMDSSFHRSTGSVFKKSLDTALTQSYNLQKTDILTEVNEMNQSQGQANSRKRNYKDVNIRKEENRKSLPGIHLCTSSVLTNDQLYPGSPRWNRAKRKRTSNTPRCLEPQRLKKTKISNNLLVFQHPQTKQMVTTCVLQNKCLQSANGTFCFDVLDSFV